MVFQCRGQGVDGGRPMHPPAAPGPVVGPIGITDEFYIKYNKIGKIPRLQGASGGESPVPAFFHLYQGVEFLRICPLLILCKLLSRLTER